MQRDHALRTRHTRIARADMSRKADLMRTEMIHRLKIFCHKLFIQNYFIKLFHKIFFFFMFPKIIYKIKKIIQKKFFQKWSRNKKS